MVDLISTSCTTRTKNKRWPINAFAFILDTLWTKLPLNSKCQTLCFRMHLVSYWCCHRLNKDMLTQTESQLILGTPEVNCCVVTSTLVKTRLRYGCVEDLVGTNVYKERREKLEHLSENKLLSLQCTDL